jgi:hypothetical protein
MGRVWFSFFCVDECYNGKKEKKKLTRSNNRTKVWCSKSLQEVIPNRKAHRYSIQDMNLST